MTTTRCKLALPGLGLITQAILVTGVSAAYGFAALTPNSLTNSSATIGYIAFLCWVFFSTASYPEDARAGEYSGLARILACVAGIYLGIFLGFHLAGAGPEALWPKDAFDTHLPRAINFANYLRGDEGILPPHDSYDRLYLTHMIIGMGFLLFGVSPGASLAVLSVLKLCTVAILFFLGREMFSKRVGFLSALLYALMPTVLFYTINLYKETMVQLLVAGASLGFWGGVISGNRKRAPYLILALGCLAGLANERFYLVVFLLLGAAAYCLAMVRKISIKYFLAASLTLMAAISCILWVKFGGDGAGLISSGRGFGVVADRIRILRSGYASYGDVNPLNYQIPYALAIFKLLFTPFFSINKFALFSNYAYLLLWGAFFNQAVIALSLFGGASAIRRFGPSHLSTVVPFIIFLLVFAAVAPYNGRLRDSFFPLIAVYAAYFMAGRGWPRLSRSGKGSVKA